MRNKAFENLIEREYMEPNWDDNNFPLCSQEQCLSYDGKRCELLGYRPGEICEPAVIQIVRLAMKEVVANE